MVDAGVNPTRLSVLWSKICYMLNRRSPRLPYFDYASARIYFVTINCKENQHLLGEIISNMDTKQIDLSEIGMISNKKIVELSSHHAGVEVLDFVVMPNHIHMLISLQKTGKNFNIISHNWFLQIGCFKVDEASFPGFGIMARILFRPCY